MVVQCVLLFPWCGRSLLITFNCYFSMTPPLHHGMSKKKFEMKSPDLSYVIRPISRGDEFLNTDLNEDEDNEEENPIR
ncbi:unnamed protein product [Nezara viridula]|uniref:Neuropeptide n=1 Tax=Nezara viridula TaxID=85310 RepID=A0A9P0H2W8_NEZVI|nr:unnamed protein product [Nezara viridula]